MSVPVALIAAVGANRVIGNEGALPWRLPTDFAFFKRMTLGKPLIMGRRTFESIGKPLPGRTNIVVTRRAGYQPDGVLVINDLAAALMHAQTIAAADGASEVMVGGGAEIYAATIGAADRLYITHVELSPPGDALFPIVDPERWAVLDSPELARTEKDSAGFCVKIYQRRDRGAR